LDPPEKRSSALFVISQTSISPVPVLAPCAFGADPLQLLVDDTGEGFRRLCAAQEDPVDQEGWRAADAEALGLLGIRLDGGPVLSGIKAAL